jgi:hypothetical protein
MKHDITILNKESKTLIFEGVKSKLRLILKPLRKKMFISIYRRGPTGSKKEED